MVTYHILTYGCQQNILDSEFIESILVQQGLKAIDNWRQADLVILNSCSVRQASEDKIYGLGREINEIRSKGQNLRVIVVGCLVGSAIGERKRFTARVLERKLQFADAWIPSSKLSQIPKYLYHWGLIEELKSPSNFFGRLPSQNHHAYVNISLGCDNFCTFCVVPYARGKEISRSEQEIMAEIKSLTQQGITHITLLGQNVNSWGLTHEDKFNIRSGSAQKLPFAALLREVHQIPQVAKISFLSSNPFDFTQDLVQTLRLPKMERYVHIALQSGDDEILRKMNRRHTAQEFMTLITSIRKAVPEIHLGTDLIVGFPGETAAAFQNTVALCQKIQFDVAFVSMYSLREGTTAAKMKDDVSKTEKRKRHQKLVEVIEKSKRRK